MVFQIHDVQGLEDGIERGWDDGVAKNGKALSGMLRSLNVIHYVEGAIKNVHSGHIPNRNQRR